jgi:hypothetical protein
MKMSRLACGPLLASLLFLGACETQTGVPEFQPVEFDGLYSFNAAADDIYMRFRIDDGYVTAVEDAGAMKEVTGGTPVQQTVKRVNFVSFSAIMAPLPERMPEHWNVSFTGDEIATGSYRGKLRLRLLTSSDDFDEFEAIFSRIGN